MAIEYEDIDLGQVSGGGTGGECEVTKEEFDLAKLEAEGWVTELVVSRANANVFTVDAFYHNTSYGEGTEFIAAIKVNDTLVDYVVSPLEDSCSTYELNMVLPVGTIIKIYHNPIVSEHIDLNFCINYIADNDTGDYPRLDIYKCLKRVRGFWSDTEVSCYSLPAYVESLELSSCCALTATVPASVKHLGLGPAWLDDGSEDGDYARFNIRFDELPAEGTELVFDDETYPDIKIFVPYHLLEMAKTRFPDYAAQFDALLPASKVSELSGSGKLYKHTVDFDFVDTANVNNDRFTQEGDEPVSFYVGLSFMSPKKYLLEGDYEISDEQDDDYDYMRQESDVGVLNDNITHHLGNGMSATVWLSSCEVLSATIIEFASAYIMFQLSDGRPFQIFLDAELDIPSTCDILDYVTEL